MLEGELCRDATHGTQQNMANSVLSNLLRNELVHCGLFAPFANNSLKCHYLSPRLVVGIWSINKKRPVLERV